MPDGIDGRATIGGGSTAELERPRPGAKRPPAPRGAGPGTPSPRRREILAAPVVAVVTTAIALLATGAAGVSFRDPDNVAAKYALIMVVAVGLLVWLDIAIRAGRAHGTARPSRQAMGIVRRTRWTRRRMLVAGTALLSFYVTYLAYRNLKGTLPLLQTELWDGELARADALLFAGQDPATVLHSLLGTGAVPAHVLSAFYAAFIVFLPLSLAIALVFARDLSTSLFFATALSINWLIGAGSYYLLPSLGPIYADPATFAALPYTEVTRLQEMLLEDRMAFLRNPAEAPPQHIAAFASLHVAMSFTALAAAHVLRLGRRLKIALWIWTAAVVLGTVYFGWHYVLDDIAGIAIGGASLWLARLLTGYEVRAAREAPAGPAAATT